MMDFNFNNINGSYEIDSDKIIINCGEKSDFFNVYDSNESKIRKIATAPYLFQEVKGDFICCVKLSSIFISTYDSAVLMLMSDEDMWAKACFELTDFGKTAVVSVVTNKYSDDANGNNIQSDFVYLKAIRVKNDFSFHYSIDGESFDMMRFFHLEVPETIKVGLVAQSPLGNSNKCIFENFNIQNTTASNIRNANSI